FVTGVDDQVHAIDEVLRAYDRAWEPKRLELLEVDEFGLSIEPGLGRSMGLAGGFFDQQPRPAPGVGAVPTRDGARPHREEAHRRAPPPRGRARQVRQPVVVVAALWWPDGLVVALTGFAVAS